MLICERSDSMASINLAKFTSVGMKELSVHLSQEKRENYNHKNKHIDKKLTHKNYCVGCSSYENALERLSDRTKEVDEKIPPKRVKKDRVVCVNAEFTCPEELDERGLSEDFFRESYSFFCRKFGRDNIHGMFVHLDEQHDYLDVRTKEMTRSRKHCHLLMSPYTDTKGINAKEFLDRELCRDIQQEFNQFCKKTWGIDYLTGRKFDSKTVEELKEISAEKERLSKELEPMKKHNQELGEEALKLSAAIKQGAEVLKKQKEELLELKQTYKVANELAKEESKNIWRWLDRNITKTFEYLINKPTFQELIYKNFVKPLHDEVKTVRKSNEALMEFLEEEFGQYGIECQLSLSEDKKEILVNKGTEWEMNMREWKDYRERQNNLSRGNYISR